MGANKSKSMRPSPGREAVVEVAEDEEADMEAVEVAVDMEVDVTDMVEMVVMAVADMVVDRVDMVVAVQATVDKEVMVVVKEDMEAEDTKLYLIMYKIPFLSILMFELL